MVYMNKIFSDKLYKVLTVIMLLIWLFITVSSICNIYPAFDNDIIKLSPVILFIGISSLILLLICIFNKISKYNTKTHNIIAIILCVIAFIIMIIWGLNYKSLFTYDLNHIEDQVQVLLNNKTMHIGESSYLSVYPHQMPLLMLIYFIKSFAIMIHVNPDNLMIIYNCIMVTLGSWFLYKVIKELFDSKVALIGLIIMLLVPDFYLYASYYYTDILSIPYCIIGFYMLIKADKIDNKLKIVYRIIGGLLFAIAFKLRVVTIFLLIAYTISILFKNNIKENIKRLTPIFTSVIVFILIYGHVLLPMFHLNTDKNLTFPSFHWIMMGANVESDGAYTQSDYEFTFEAKNKVSTDIKEYKKRLKKTNIEFISNKIRRVWTQGDHDVNRKYKNVNKVDGMYRFLNGASCIFLRYLQQIVLCLIYILFMIAILFELIYKRTLKNSIFSTFLISIFGAFIFYLLWEAQPRYSLTFIPWIIIGGSYSIVKLKKLFEVKEIKIDKLEISFKNVKKIFGISLIVLSVLNTIISFNEFCLTKKKTNLIRYSQYYGTNHFPVIKDSVKQEFSVRNNFNVIELMFNGVGDYNDLKYNFKLYNSKDKLIYEKEFDGKWATKGMYARFRVPKQKLKNEEKFYFTISSKDSTEDNYLNIGAYLIDNCREKDLYYKNEGYDPNPSGNTYLGNKKLCYETRYKIIESKKTNLISKKIFIPFALLNLCLIITTSYLLLIKENKEMEVEKNINKKTTKKKTRKTKK